MKGSSIQKADAKFEVEPASAGKEKPNEKGTRENSNVSQVPWMGAEGLEPPTLSV